MLRRVSQWISRNSTGRIVLLSLAIFLVFTAVVLPYQASKTEAYAGEVGSVDLKLFYTPDEVYQIAEAYGEDGRSLYVKARLTFDVIWPFVYAFFLSTAISYIVQRVLDEDSWWQFSNLVPLCGLLFDYMENISITVVMLKYPIRLTWLAGMTAIFTGLKWILISFGCVLLVFGLFVWKIIHNNTQENQEIN